MSDDYFGGGHGAIWLQPDGANTAPAYLGCHELGDITAPGGDITRTYCPDPSGPNRWKSAFVAQGPPGGVTTSIAALVGPTADFLTTIVCPVPVYVHQSLCGRTDTFLNYDAGTQVQNGRITSETKSNFSQREGTDPATLTAELEGDPPMIQYWKLAIARQSTEEAEALLDIAMCGEDRCAGYCGASEEKCDNLGIGAGGAGTANYLSTTDGGNIWATDVGPFGAGEFIASVVCFDIDRNVTRILVGNGLGAAKPPEVAYSDDGGDNWSAAIPIGAVDNDFFATGGNLWATDQYHVWGVTDPSGDIWFSEDGGVTWTEQVTTNVNSLSHVHFLGTDLGLTVGELNTILSTVDGGAHWTVEDGPGVQDAIVATSCRVVTRNRWFIGYADGEIWYTENAGANFYQRTFPVPVGAVTIVSITDIDFWDEFHGAFSTITTTATGHSGSIHRTVNGGYNWEGYAMPDDMDTDGTPGLNALIMCNPNLIYTVGDPVDSLGAIYVLAPST